MDESTFDLLGSMAQCSSDGISQGLKIDGLVFYGEQQPQIVEQLALAAKRLKDLDLIYMGSPAVIDDTVKVWNEALIKQASVPDIIRSTSFVVEDFGPIAAERFAKEISRLDLSRIMVVTDFRNVPTFLSWVNGALAERRENDSYRIYMFPLFNKGQYP